MTRLSNILVSLSLTALLWAVASITHAQIEPHPQPSFQDDDVPVLDIGVQYVPSDKTGRLAAGADKLLELTPEPRGNFWPTHIFAELFWKSTLDKYYVPYVRHVLNPDGTIESKLTHRLDHTKMREFADLIDEHANLILATYMERFGAPPPGILRVFPDLETATLGGRQPYNDEEYGERCIWVMTFLCDRIEFQGKQRGWQVWAGPYRPLRPTGFVSARPTRVHEPMRASFVEDWGAPRIGVFLKRKVVWGHIYQPEDEAGLKGATHEDYTYRQIKWMIEQITAAKGSPEELWICDWVYTEPTYTEALGIFKGFKKAWAEFGHLLPNTEPRIMFAGGWGQFEHILGIAVERLEPNPLVLSIPTEETGIIYANAWNSEIVRAYREAFGIGVVAEPVGN